MGGGELKLIIWVLQVEGLPSLLALEAATHFTDDTKEKPLHIS